MATAAAAKKTLQKFLAASVPQRLRVGVASRARHASGFAREASVRRAIANLAGALPFGSQVTVTEQRLQDFLRAELAFFAQRSTQTLTLEQILDASTPGRAAKLVHKELPFRFAFRIRHVEALPGWERHPELRQLHNIFTESFRELRMAEPPSDEELRAEDLQSYTQVVRVIRKRHKPVVALLAEAMRKRHAEGSVANIQQFQSWADSFLLSRISTEMLTSHYLAMVSGTSPAASWSDPMIMKSYWDDTAGPSSVGIVDTKCNPGHICQQAAADVRQSLASGGLDPGVVINVHAHNCSSTQGPIEFSYIPKYLFFIVQELLWNSARATVEAHHAAGVGKISDRPITVTVTADKRQVAIRISDQGGGVPFGKADQIWSYLMSTSKEPYEVYVDHDSPLSGWGMGLPLGRLYARYLGGSLDLMNMPGIGVDAYLFLRRIAPAGVHDAKDLPTSLSDSISPFSSLL